MVVLPAAAGVIFRTALPVRQVGDTVVRRPCPQRPFYSNNIQLPAAAGLVRGVKVVKEHTGPVVAPPEFFSSTRQ